jgi:uncharacterized protein (DUF2336 family)
MSARLADLQPLQPLNVAVILERRNMEEWLALASQAATPVEALYYMAEHGNMAVREAIARNTSAPGAANMMLVQDEDESVRRELATKIGRLAPDLSQGQLTRVREQAIAVLDALAQDEAPRVRAMIAEAICACADIPRDIARRLAEDRDLAVCGPILEYSPLLDDNDLKEIIAAAQSSGAVASIARRDHVSADVADTVARTRDIVAVSALLSNANAQIREETLDALLDDAPEVKAWHEPLAMRANLSVRVMMRIAGFVASRLVDKMLALHVVNKDDAQQIMKAVRKRISSSGTGAAALDRFELQARQAIESGIFSDKWVAEMIASQNHVSIICALGLSSGVGVLAARSVIGSRDARAVMALCWKAGLGARCGFEVQQLVAFIPIHKLLAPHDGIDYPDSAQSMEMSLNRFA